MSNSTKLTPPRKPHKDFPLFPHATRRWAKKVRGKMEYFGPWDDPDAALAKWNDEKDDLLAGRVPRSRRAADEYTLRELCNRFLTTKKRKQDAGKFSPRTFLKYHALCESLVDHFGTDRLLTDLLPEDFESLWVKWSRKWGPVRLRDQINTTKTLFNYAVEEGLLKTVIRYGSAFRSPDTKDIQQVRNAKGPRMFTSAELRRIIDVADQPLKAMILLAINCGFGNSDIGSLPLKALDLSAGWVEFPRPKTAQPRRCPLWRETVAALREAIAQRPTPRTPEVADLVFLTIKGNSWNKSIEDNPLSKSMRKLLKKLDINGNKNFYAIRHTHETIAGDSRDQVATDFIMGHKRNDMAAVYRERGVVGTAPVSDARLKAVTDHVHGWLFAKAKAAKRPTKKKPALRVFTESA